MYYISTKFIKIYSISFCCLFKSNHQNVITEGVNLEQESLTYKLISNLLKRKIQGQHHINVKSICNCHEIIPNWKHSVSSFSHKKAAKKCCLGKRCNVTCEAKRQFYRVVKITVWWKIKYMYNSYNPTLLYPLEFSEKSNKTKRPTSNRREIKERKSIVFLRVLCAYNYTTPIPFHLNILLS